MNRKRNDAFLLKIGDGADPETFATVGGFRPDCFSETIDVTNKDSGDRLAVIACAGSLSISGSGVFVDDTAFALAHAATTSKTIDNWQVIIPGHIWEGPFHVTSLEFEREYNREMAYSISLESAGAISNGER